MSLEHGKRLRSIDEIDLNFSAVDEYEINKRKEEEKRAKTVHKPRKSILKSLRKFGHALMIPHNITSASELLNFNVFDGNWIARAIPQGTQCLVNTSSGRTYAYLRDGHKLFTFSSALPSGSNHYK